MVLAAIAPATTEQVPALAVAVQLFDWIIEVPLVPMPVQASAFRTARVWCLTVEFQAVVMFVWYPAGTSSR
jgi:hypothetical protein